MDNYIIKTIQYFSFFRYAPTIEEIWKFFPRKISFPALKALLRAAVSKKLIIEHKDNTNNIIKSPRYTVGEYSIKSILHLSKRKNISENKIKKVAHYTHMLSFFPQIKLIGLSGSVAMMSAGRNDDVDIFIITAKRRIWTGRWIAILLAHILGLRRKRTEKKAPGKICLNLFFDENVLEVPKFKKNGYVAHEILQMKPLVNKEYAYERFLDANKWVFRMFPNAGRANSKVKRQKAKIQFKSKKFLGNIFERLLKEIQLFSIRKHQTTEIVTDTQFWFFPDDFEKKMRSKLI